MALVRFAAAFGVRRARRSSSLSATSAPTRRGTRGGSGPRRPCSRWRRSRWWSASAVGCRGSLVVFAACNVAAYLVYFVFDDWSYLRFLLPGMAAAAVLASVVVTERLSGEWASMRAALWFACALALVAHGVSVARARGAFELAGQQHRVAGVGERLRADIPDTGVIISGEQSGALRYYTGPSVLRWDDASAEELSQALAALGASGRDVGWRSTRGRSRSIARSSPRWTAARSIGRPPSMPETPTAPARGASPTATGSCAANACRRSVSTDHEEQATETQRHREHISQTRPGASSWPRAFGQSWSSPSLCVSVALLSYSVGFPGNSGSVFASCAPFSVHTAYCDAYIDTAAYSPLLLVT